MDPIQGRVRGSVPPSPPEEERVSQGLPWVRRPRSHMLSLAHTIESWACVLDVCVCVCEYVCVCVFGCVYAFGCMRSVCVCVCLCVCLCVSVCVYERESDHMCICKSPCISIDLVLLCVNNCYVTGGCKIHADKAPLRRCYLSISSQYSTHGHGSDGTLTYTLSEPHLAQDNRCLRPL